MHLCAKTVNFSDTLSKKIAIGVKIQIFFTRLGSFPMSFLSDDLQTFDKIWYSRDTIYYLKERKEYCYDQSIYREKIVG